MHEQTEEEVQKEASPSPQPLQKTKRDEKAMWYVPWTVTSFDELSTAEAANEKAEAYNLLSSQFIQIAENILWADEEEVPDKDKALTKLAQDMAVRMKAVGEDQPVAGGAKELLRKVVSAFSKATPADDEEEDEEEEEDEGEPVPTKSKILFTKQDDGTYRWLATYSNSVLDKHGEIISSDSHIRFEKMVDSGQYEYPELWLHHEPGWCFGVADFIATDDRGDGLVFAIAGGTVNKGFEALAEELSKLELTVSHGMAPEEHKYHPEIPGLIIEHKTVEISPLLKDLEANDLTLITISKEADTMVSKQKRDMYASQGAGLGEQLEALENANGTLADKALTQGRMHKENEMTEPTEAPPEAGAEQSQDPTLNDVVGAVKELSVQLKAIAESTAEGFTGIDSKVDARLKSIEDRLGAVEGVQSTKSALTPAASLDSVVKSVIGDPETKVDGRTVLGKSGPEIAKEGGADREVFGIPFLDKLKNNSAKGSFVSPYLQNLMAQQAPVPAGVNGDGGE